MSFSRRRIVPMRELERMSFNELSDYVQSTSSSILFETSRRLLAPSLFSMVTSPPNTLPSTTSQDQDELDYEALLLLDEDVKKRGVSSSSRRRYLTEHYSTIEFIGKQCDICMEKISKSTRKIISLPCKHFYHSDCILKWFEQNRTCPVCRYEIPDK